MAIAESTSPAVTPGQKLVVMGVGYVGMNLCQESVRAGHQVIGLDINPMRVEAIKNTIPPPDSLTTIELTELLDRGFVATTDPSVLGTADTVVLCVPTPLSAGLPDLTAIEAAARTVRDHLRAGMLVVLESTTHPGTTQDVVAPILAESGLTIGDDVALAYSPERIQPGNPSHRLRDTPKVVAGLTPACTVRAADFYRTVVDTVVVAAGLREAEMAKLLENIYLNVNIALVNEIAMVCGDLGVDVWDVIRCASSKPYDFQAFTPGPGVGGHCIPVDPVYLTTAVRTQLGRPAQLIETAHEINQRMPHHVAQRAHAVLSAHEIAPALARIILVGITYKPDVADLRETPACPIARLLLESGAYVSYNDPHVSAWTVDDRAVPPSDLSQHHDLAIFLQHHRATDADPIIAACAAVLDTRGKLSGPSIVRI
ncbi:nucleotide sugar dehydrogenase [Nocardia uniformis]|uniref:Nucleotide sugar dehydrogenase n=1 Tax=Nocardia uniformis TaxID=53432 RepID=A0A849CD81_9NOCA|nr:nucleotide sugar dehydrogenase [Nocardia uniformis]NNH71021.1 nucleotide sugar dehydrogenase [Nocardia uniformis]